MQCTTSLHHGIFIVRCKANGSEGEVRLDCTVTTGGDVGRAFASQETEGEVTQGSESVGCGGGAYG